MTLQIRRLLFALLHAFRERLDSLHLELQFVSVRTTKQLSALVLISQSTSTTVFGETFSSLVE